jgi:hypothetical protein
MGHLVEAERLFAEVASMPPDPLQSAEGKTAREDAVRLLADLEKRIPSLVVKLEGLQPGQPPPTVRLDGDPFPSEKLGQPQKLNPGEHRVFVVVGKRWEQTKTVAVPEGRTQEVVFDVDPKSVHAPWSGQRTLAVAAVAIGGAVLVASAVVGLSASSKFGDAKKLHCGPAVGASNEDQCDAQGLSDRKDAGTSADIATILLAVGGVGIGAGAVLWLTAPGYDARSGGATGNVRGLLVRGAF